MKPEHLRSERSSDPAPDDTAAHPAEAGSLWEQFLSRSNLAEAFRRVEQNAGAAGIDGMSTEELRPWLHDHWSQIRSQLEAGTYRPQPVRRVMIPKPSSGVRMLGVPAAVDRLICQAIAQVLTPVFDPHFHPHSFGFRPGCHKPVVDRAIRRPLLGFGFFVRGGQVKVRIDPKARKRAKDRLRQLTSRRWGVSMERRIEEINRFTVGWTAYYRLADTHTPFEELDEWLRRRLRQVRWKEWKRPRTRRRNLRALDINELNARQWASSRKGYWRIAGSWVLCYALPNAYWSDLGLKGFSIPTAVSGMLSEPPGADPHAGSCGGRRGELGAYPITTRRVIGLKCVIRGFSFGRSGHRSSSQASVAPSATKQPRALASTRDPVTPLAVRPRWRPLRSNMGSSPRLPQFRKMLAPERVAASTSAGCACGG